MPPLPVLNFMKFEDFKLTYGYPLQLQTNNSSGQTARFSSRLIGCIPGRAILLSVPRAAGKIVRFRPGQKIVVRMMIDNGIGIFLCMVESVSSDPYPILHVSYPEQVSFKGIRGATRVMVNLPIMANNVSAIGHMASAGVVADISISGARIEMETAIGEIGDRIELSAQLNIENITRDVNLHAVIRSRVERSTQEEEQNLPAIYGIEFVEEREDQRLCLYAYVFGQMAKEEQLPQ